MNLTSLFLLTLLLIPPQTKKIFFLVTVYVKQVSALTFGAAFALRLRRITHKKLVKEIVDNGEPLAARVRQDVVVGDVVQAVDRIHGSIRLGPAQERDRFGLGANERDVAAVDEDLVGETF